MSKSGIKWTWKNFHHKYVELHVRAMERVPAMNRYVSVPQWVATLMNYPDSTTRGGKTLGYHVAHGTAILSILLTAGLALPIAWLTVGRKA